MDFKAFQKIIIEYKGLLIGIVLAYLVLGLAIVFLTPKTFKAQSVLLPETKDSSLGNSGGLSQLASSIPGLGSFNLPAAGSDAFRPEFYPSIVQSTPFILEFKNHKFFHPDFNENLTIESYLQKYAPFNTFSFIKKYTIGLPGLILGIIRGTDEEDLSKANEIVSSSNQTFYRPSVGEFKFLKDLRDMVAVSVDKKTGLITISVETTNAVVSAYLAQFTQEYLVDFMEKYRNEKQTRIISFLEDKKIELEKQFNEDQSKLANFKDRNFNISSASLINQQENLTSKYELSKNLFFNINSQLEQARIKLNEEHPLFATIEPVYIPPLKNKPQTFLILFLTGSLGIISAAIFILFKSPIKFGDTD